MANKDLNKPASQTTILVTGGAGYIGTHTDVELLESGYKVVVVDDLSNSKMVAMDRVAEIAGLQKLDDKSLEGLLDCDAIGKVRFYSKPESSEVALAFIEANVLSEDALERVFDAFDIDAIIHFAGFKAVGESVEKPLEYYHNNITNTLVLTDVARRHGVKNIIFSSTATVYGEPDSVPLTEESPLHPPTNPYSRTKSMLEQILTDIAYADEEYDVALLRYFNPIGAHESGRIGEDPNGIPNNLLPYVAQVAVGKLPEVGVFGDDYPTPDGTGIRDYIHVVDLARGHVAALEWMAQHVDGKPRHGVEAFNLGTGVGSSVLDVIKAFSKACGKGLPYSIKPRRAGDIAEYYSACDKARDVLGWSAEYDLDRMCEDSWRWQSLNPDGYPGE